MFGAFKALSSPRKFFAGMWFSLMFVATRFKVKIRHVDGGLDVFLMDMRPDEGDPVDELEKELKK